MQTASSGSSAAPFSVLITNGDTHSPMQWAELTTGRIMNLDEEMPYNRAILALELRSCVRDILGDVFSKVRDEAKRLDIIKAETIANSLSYKIGRAAQGTPWQLHFSHPETRKMIWLEILRSLNTIITEERKHSGKGH